MAIFAIDKWKGPNINRISKQQKHNKQRKVVKLTY